MFTTTLGKDLAAALAKAEEVWVAVALLNEYGVEFLQKHTNPAASVHMLVGVD